MNGGIAFFELKGHGLVELTGPDAQSFLQNLCTQDVRNVRAGESAEAFLTTNKARVIAHVWITQRDANVYWLDMVAGQAEKVVKHLNHYLISERVEIAVRTAEFVLLRLHGVIELQTDCFIRRQNLLSREGIDFLVPTSEVATVRDRLIAAGAIPGNDSTYHTLRIEAGLPEYGIDIDENRLAMEVNRTAQAISYAKGCYLGQETIVMARDRGQVNRLLMGVKVAGDAPLDAGAKLYRGDSEVGEVTSSVFSPRLQQVLALGYLRRGHWDAGTELVVEGRTAVVSALPF